MRATVQMIFTVQEVRQSDSGTIQVRGYVFNGRDNGKASYASVTVFITEALSHFAEAAVSLERGQRVFVCGTVSLGAYQSNQAQEPRAAYRIFPSAFVPLDVPVSEEPEAEEAEYTEEPQNRRVEMSGTARPTGKVAQSEQRPADGRRPTTFTIPRPQRVSAAPTESESYDPFAE